MINKMKKLTLKSIDKEWINNRNQSKEVILIKVSLQKEHQNQKR